MLKEFSITELKRLAKESSAIFGEDREPPHFS